MQNAIARSTRKRQRRPAAPTRHFDVTVGAITAREHVDDALTEDRALTNYLTSAWSDLISPRSTPVPRCPYCDGARIRAGRQRKGELPRFFCHRCRRHFNRLTLTPFAQLKNHDKGTAMIPLLSRQMSMKQAGERLGRTNKAILSWLLAFRRYLLELDPSGRWEARVRLGVRIAPRAQCLRCGFEGGFKSGGFDPQRRRRICCPQCGRSRLLDVLQDEGQGLVGVILHDAVDTAVRHRRKLRPNTVVPAVARAAHVDETTMTIRPRRQLVDIELPARSLPRGPMDQLEDCGLSAYLIARIDAALSQSMKATPCPWCDSAQTEYHPAKRPNGLPGFKCRGCLGYFTRVTNSPLVSAQGREIALHLVPMLGWRNTIETAAQVLGASATQLRAWLIAWRQWLLVLDPSGAMEARVSLGLPMKEAPNLIEIRARKRKQWLARGWSRRGDGCSYLSADGYVVRVGGATAWQFELRAIGEIEVIRSRGGFRSIEDARLAAFDAITDLLSAAPTSS